MDPNIRRTSLLGIPIENHDDEKLPSGSKRNNCIILLQKKIQCITLFLCIILVCIHLFKSLLVNIDPSFVEKIIIKALGNFTLKDDDFSLPIRNDTNKQDEI